MLAVDDHLPKPLLRGWLHMVCFFLAFPVGALVVALAGDGRARIAALVYAFGLVAVFGVSGFYHRGRWSPTWQARMQRLDHSTIFVMIAGTYTPICLLVLSGWLAPVMLVAAWLGAVAGTILAWTGGHGSRMARSSLYIALGWLVVAAMPQLFDGLTTAELLLVMAGGLLYTVGAIAFAAKWPDPWPRHFGFHEVWHVFTVLAATCHLIAVASVVHAA